jgi:ATP diphosphatase
MTPPTPPAPGHRFAELVEVMERLLAPDGCPWDREQTLATLRPFLIEETYEVLDAMDGGDPAAHCEELGDLLMQVVFQAALRRREGAFDVDDVSAGIVAKLVRRHPHVFPPASGATSTASTSAEVLTQWDQIKAAEKARKGDQAAGPARTLASVPRGLPSLVLAQKLGHKAGKVGFDWGGWQGSLAKVREEVDEVVETAEAADPVAAHHEIGDLLFAVVNLARKLDVDAELALRDASTRFTKRFEFIEDRLAEGGRGPKDSNLEEMDALWNAAKAAGVGKR